MESKEVIAYFDSENNWMLVFLIIQLGIIAYLLISNYRKKKVRVLLNEDVTMFSQLNRELEEKNSGLMEAEEHFRTSEERFRLAIEGSHDGVWDWNLENDEVFLSKRWKSILGYEDDELLNELKTWKDLVFEEDLDIAMEKVGNFIQGTSNTYEVQFRMKHKNGQLVPILARGFMMRNHEAKAYRIIGTHFDLTERYNYEKILKEKAEEYQKLYEDLRIKNDHLLSAEEELRANMEELHQKRQELEMSEERFRLAIMGSHDGVWDWDLQNNHTYFSETWKSIIGYENHELKDELSTWQDCTCDEDLPIAMQKVEDFIKGSASTYEVEFRMKHKNGRLVPILARGYLMRNSGGKAIRIIGTHQDLTERYENEEKLQKQVEENLSLYEEYRTISEELHNKNNDLLAAEEELRANIEELNTKNNDLLTAEEELRANNEELHFKNVELIASEERYRLLFNNLNEGFALHEIVVDENDKAIDYIFRDVNPTFLSRIGMKYDDVVNKSAKELFPGTELSWIEKFADVAFSGKADRFTNYSSAIDKYYETHVFSPGKGFFAAIFDDVTEYRKSEQALMKSEERFKKIFDSSKSVMLIQDPKTGKIKDANTAAVKFYGYDIKELIGLNINHINLLTRDKIKKEMAFAIEGERNHFQFEHLLKSGDIRNVDVYTTPIEVEDRTLLHSIIFDSTDKVEAEYLVQQVNQRFQGLENIVHYRASSINDLMNFTLKQIIEYTQSETGAVYEYDIDKGLFVLNNWSDEINLVHKKSSHLEGIDKLDCLNKAARLKKAVIINNPIEDYPFQKRNKLKGELLKSITIPVISGNAVVALFWLGSKNKLYSKFHAEQIKLLLDTAWILVEKQRFQDAYKQL